MSGLGYNGRDPKDPQGKNHHFNRVENISIHEVELSENPRMMMESWNKNTASWLKRSIYTRFLDNQPGRLSAATYLTYFVSALWHGFRPGYYFCFLSASLMTLSGRALRKHIRPLFLQGTKLHPFKPVYDVLGWAGTIFLINYCTMPFVAQTLARSITAWASIAFLGHILMVSVLLVSRNRGLTRKIEAFGKSIQLADAQKKKE